jgi:Protein of unknown function (DUF4245)
MFWSIAPLVIACIALAGLVGMCSFQPAGPGNGPPPSYDATAALRADATVLGFPVRDPALPAGWQPNSGGRGGIENGRTDPRSHQQVRAVTSTVGYLTPTGMYLALMQSNADEDKLVSAVRSGMYPTGVQNVNGVTWVVYQGGQGEQATEPVWTARLDGPTGPAQVAVTGAGSSAEFRTLAAATQAQPPLPTTR